MKEKIRLMQITHDLAIGGLQQVIVNICRNLDRDKYDVTVLCLRELGEFVPQIEELGIKVLYLPQKERGADYFAFLKVAKILKELKIDVIHTHNTQPFFDGTLGAMLSGVKAVIHTDHVRSFPDKLRYMFAEWVMSLYAYKVVGVSDDTCNNLIKYEHISRKKIVTIVNGIDESIYNIDIDREKKKQELGVNKQGWVIGLGARLSKQKGIIYLLRAMPSILKELPDLTLVIAGQGECRNELEDEAKKLGVDGSIVFAGPRLDMPEVLKVFDLFVLPSLYEGLPMVLLEAMAARCPVVATDVGGNYMAITHGVNGSLVEAANPEVFAKEVIKVLNDKVLYDNYIEKSVSRIQSEFSAKMMTQKYEKLYQEALRES